MSVARTASGGSMSVAGYTATHREACLLEASRTVCVVKLGPAPPSVLLRPPSGATQALGEQSVRFRSGNASIKGGAGGAVLVGAFLAWATLTGRVHEPDLAYFGGWIAGGVVMAVLTWRAHRASVRHAASWGQIDLDDWGLRWIRSDQSLALEFEWSRVQQATVDPRTSTVIVVVRSEAPDAPPSATLFGDPTGAVLFDDFDEFSKAIGRHCGLEEAVTAPEQCRPLAKRLWGWAAVFGTIGAVLFWINGMLEGAGHTRPMVPLIPIAFGSLAVVYVLAGLAFWRGRAPTMSQFYNPRFLGRRVPMMSVLLVLLNFLLVWVGAF